MSLPVRRRIGDGACVSALGAPIRLEIEVVGGLPVHLSRRLRILQRNYIRSWVRRLVCNWRIAVVNRTSVLGRKQKFKRRHYRKAPAKTLRRHPSVH
jgi:hypothetical protein